MRFKKPFLNRYEWMILGTGIVAAILICCAIIPNFLESFLIIIGGLAALSLFVLIMSS